MILLRLLMLLGLLRLLGTRGVLAAVGLMIAHGVLLGHIPRRRDDLWNAAVRNVTNPLVTVETYVVHILKPMEDTRKASRTDAKDSDTDTSDSVLTKVVSNFK